ncbi:SEC-C domain-containing protein [Allokutzneria sp. A3M-2-11 16]|uniref:SEC-C domain-containing protein n=1 Tax=Allokutzneria sp. A3M-2-11 16 TaxID=2962043 RepID=UPI0020B8760E|nr:SEC-C domain-containing protein [Allokutzneria sp. A3M-2-11 16]MCP3800802.1 SEC-C domain-containing protein [Allokutzneria sp. A3M-2-11 16]
MPSGGLLTAGAEALAERAVEANREHGDPDGAYPRALRAQLLAKLGRQDEAAAVMTALRPLLKPSSSSAARIPDGDVPLVLLQQRYRLRRVLDLPYDERDRIADELDGLALLLWPRAEFDGLLSFWPEFGDIGGRTDAFDDYTRSLAEQERASDVPWPPPRNQPCWCGSGLKDKKCCLPRGRS